MRAAIKKCFPLDVLSLKAQFSRTIKRCFLLSDPCPMRIRNDYSDTNNRTTNRVACFHTSVKSVRQNTLDLYLSNIVFCFPIEFLLVTNPSLIKIIKIDFCLCF